MKPVFESINSTKEKTITAFKYTDKSFVTPWHFHPQHELTLIDKSCGTKFIGDYVGTYRPGELVLLRSNVPHCWKNLVDEEVSSSFVTQWNTKIFTPVPELALVFTMLDNASRGLIFDATAVQPLLEKIEELHTLSGQFLYLALLEVLVQLSTCKTKTLSGASFRDNITTVHQGRMEKVHNFVSENYQRKIYLKEVSDEANMSEQSFSRFFTKMMGRSFFTFLNEYRIKRACQLLPNTHLQISEISFLCGFESKTFFYRQFKKFMNCSPMEYQKKYKSPKKP